MNMKIQADKKGSLHLLALGDYGLDIWNTLKEKKEISPPSPVTNTNYSKEKTLLIGWDSADWSIIRPMMAAGKMPALKKFLEKGCSGRIKTLQPSFSPMLWTSIATGKLAHKHGILGFVEPSSDGTDIQPVQSTSRKCHALWNILGSRGYKSNVIGWWPSHPAEPISGEMVTNQFQKIKYNKKGEPRWITENTVHPEALKINLDHLRIHSTDLTEAHLLPFIPEAQNIDQSKGKLLRKLAEGIAQSSTVHATTTYLMRTLTGI